MSVVIKDFSKELKDFMKTHKVLKKKFEKIITNEKIPLRDRLELWINTDSTLKNHHDYIPTFRRGEVTKGEKALTEWIDDQDYHRGSVDIGTRFEDDIYFMYHPEDMKEGSEFSDYSSFTSPEELQLVMEQVLKMNLGSFDWDW